MYAYQEDQRRIYGEPVEDHEEQLVEMLTDDNQRLATRLHQFLDQTNRTCICMKLHDGKNKRFIQSRRAKKLKFKSHLYSFITKSVKTVQFIKTQVTYIIYI